MGANEQSVNSAAAAGQLPNTVQQRPKFESFAHMLHFTGVGDPPLRLILEPRALNPGFWTKDGVRKNDPLQQILQDMLDKNKQFQKLRIALVDLTDDKLTSPQFAGHRELEHGTIGSSAKMGAMYGAFQLRFDLEVLAQDLEIKKKDDLFDAARDYWSLTQIEPANAQPEEFLSDNPKLELHGSLVKKNGKKMSLECLSVQKDVNGKVLSSTKVAIGAPKLEEIFDVTETTSPLKIAFTSEFAKKLQLMTRHSDNSAAHDCITTIGYLYLDSVLWQSDLYNPKRHGGLWLGGSYPKSIGGGKTQSFLWQPAPVGDDPKKEPTRQCGTAAAAAALLTLVGQGDLVNKDASTEMRNTHLDIFASDGYGSWFSAGLIEAKRFTSADKVFAKLGIADGKLFDCVLLRRTDPQTNKLLRCAMVGLDAPQTAEGEKLFKSLAVELDKCIQQNNAGSP